MMKGWGILETIHEQLLHTTLCIETFDKDNKPISIGTGFLLERPLSGDRHKLYLVSNKHVLVGPYKIIIRFNKRVNDKPSYGDVLSFPIEGINDIVVGHPNPHVDIAVLDCTGLFINFTDKIYYKYVNYEMLSDFQEAELAVAENVHFVGYPDGRYDQANNLPLIRTGMISSHPKLDFNGLPQFIIDAQVFPGSSGSPVFIDLTYENFRNGMIEVGGPKKIKLLGIIAMTMIRNNRLQAIPTGTVFQTEEVLGLGIVFKATAIKELIDTMPFD